tara:strand:- start:139 stop:1047 length:909 start_codon:yes stop_codon:yes gene_type:complete
LKRNSALEIESACCYTHDIHNGAAKGLSMKAIIRKAVFPVAGFGTRFLPVTKAMPKELLPVVNKPLIQYAADEAIAAGCDTLIFVTGRNKRAVEDHFDSNLELEAALRAKGKHAEAESLRNIVPPHVKCIFVRQPEQLGLGHAVLCAERAVGDEPFAVLLADDFLIGAVPGVMTDLIEAYTLSGKSQISVMQVDGPQISQYGVVRPGAGVNEVAGLIEKPALQDATSNLASIGRYLLTPDVFDILRDQSPGHGGEVQLVDAIDTMAAGAAVCQVPLTGLRFDCGSLEGYLDAIKYVTDHKLY